MHNKTLLAANNRPFEMLFFPTFVETINHFVYTHVYIQRWFQLRCPSFMWVEYATKFWVKILTVIHNCLVCCAQSYLMELIILVSSLPGRRFLHCTRKLGCLMAQNSMVKHRSVTVDDPSSYISCLKLQHRLLSISRQSAGRSWRPLCLIMVLCCQADVSLELVLYKLISIKKNES